MESNEKLIFGPYEFLPLRNENAHKWVIQSLVSSRCLNVAEFFESSIR